MFFFHHHHFHHGFFHHHHHCWHPFFPVFGIGMFFFKAIIALIVIGILSIVFISMLAF